MCSNKTNMRKILLTVLVSLTFYTNAQTSVYHPFPDSSATWNIQHTSICMMGNSNENYSITISGDTIIQSQTYHKLIIPFVKSNNSGVCDFTTIGYKGAFRQDKTK